MSNKQRNLTPWFIAGAILLLMLSTMSFFISTNIYDSQRFARKTTDAITSEAAREAIAKEITSEVLSDQSLVLKRVASEPIEALIAGLLKTDAFSSVFFEFSNSLNRFITTKDFKPVTINIASITNTVDTVVNTIKPDNNLDLSKYETEEIVLFENTDLPPFKSIGQVLLILGPVSLLLLITTALLAFNKAGDKRDLLKYSGQVLIVSGAILLVITFTGSGFLTIGIIDPERSIIMQEIYNSFVGNFRTIQIIMVLLGGILYGLYYYLVNDVSLSIKPRKE